MHRAFTLVEVLITVALFAVLMFAVTQLYIVFGRVIVFQKASIDVALGGSSIMDNIRLAGLQADHIIASHVFSGISYNSGTTTAIFELPSINSSGSIIPGAYDYIGIYSSGTNAYRIIDTASGSARTGEYKQLTGVLNALSFTYDNPDFTLVTNVTANATTSVVVRGETTQTHLREHIYLRNL